MQSLRCGSFSSIRSRCRDRHPSVERLEERCLLAAATSLGQLPIDFEVNQGQVSAPVVYLARTEGSTLFITPGSATLAIPTSTQGGMAIRMSLVGATATPVLAGSAALPGLTNYLAGSNPTGAHLGVDRYGSVVESGVYPGVDLTYRASDRQFEYDFTVGPGADPGLIQFQLAGQDMATLDPSGNLILRTAARTMVEQAPEVYQEVEGERQAVSGHFVLGESGTVRFAVGAYNKSLPLIIDPVLGFSTFLGEGGQEGGYIAVDSASNTYLVASSLEPNYPTTPGAYQSSIGDINYNAVVVTKIDPTGSKLIYSTYIGEGLAAGIAVDPSGNVFLTGSTNSTRFPTTPGAFQTNPLDRNQTLSAAFVAKLNSSGTSLIYSTLLGVGGSTIPSGIAIDAVGNAYLVGQTDTVNLPTTPGAYRPNPQATLYGLQEPFVAAFNPSGSALIYSTYLGAGLTASVATAIAVSPTGEAVITGYTAGHDDTFPTTAGAFQRSDSGLNEFNVGFVTQFNAAGSALLYSTYLGGVGRSNSNYPIELYPTAGFINPGAIALDRTGAIYVAGSVQDSTFPTTPGAIATPSSHLFLTKIDPRRSDLVYSVLFGGPPPVDQYLPYGSEARGLAVDSAGNAYVTGATNATTFPTVDAIQATFGGGVINSSVFNYPLDAYLIGFNPTGSEILFSTYLGGSDNEVGRSIAIDPAGGIYVSGTTTSVNFPTTSDAFDPIYQRGDGNNYLNSVDHLFLTKILPSVQFSTTSASIPAAMGSAFITVTRTGNLTGAATITVQAAPGTANAGSDYVFANQLLTFAPGVASQAARVEVRVAPGSESTRTVILTLSDPSASVGLGSLTRLVLTIIEPTATTLKLQATSGQTTLGQAVTLSATVSTTTGSPTGTVTFRSGATLLGIAPIDADGTASITTTELSAGANAITASFSGDTRFGASTDATVAIVDRLVSVVSLTPIAVDPAVSHPFVLVAQPQATTSTTAIPTGLAEFLDGTTVIAVIPLDVDGNAVLFLPSLTATTHQFTVIYIGDANYNLAINRTASYALGPPTVRTIHKIPAGLVIPFDQDLDPASARRLSNYRVSTEAGRSIRVRSATYDSSTQTVTIRLAERPTFHGRYYLRITGQGPLGVRGRNGQFLAEADRSSSNYAGKVSHALLVRSPRCGIRLTSHPRGPIQPS